MLLRANLAHIGLAPIRGIMLPQDQQQQSALPRLPDFVKAVAELCPHGLMLRSEDAVLYANSAWSRLHELPAPPSSLESLPAENIHQACFKLTFEDRPVELRVIQDVTARTQLETQLRELQRLESLGRCVGSIVHDFRNVLTAVMLYSDLLAQTAEPGSVAAKYNREVKNAATRGTNLISQLLSFVRQRAPEVRAVSVNSLLNSVRDVVCRMAGEDVDVVFDLCESPCRARVDATQIQQVVFNLAMNSKQAMPDGGRVIIRTRDLRDRSDRPSPEDASGWIELTFTDDGVGMDEPTLRRAFDPFFTTKPKGKGTGLGLTTVQSIVAQYGGTVSIDSKPAKGTTVTILLPRVDAERPDPATEQVRDAPKGSEAVLLVEDDASVRNSMAEMLGELGYRVLQASTGLDAIRVAQQHDGPIDLLITDMVLPGLSGREIARQIKLGRPDLHVLFISGYEPDRESHGPDIFSKPFTKQALARKVREALDSGRHGLSRAVSTSV